jgi:hypothetical protein
MQYDLSMPRYTIDFDDKFDRTLSDLLESTDATTKADVIRRAVASYSYLKKAQQENKNAKVVVTDNAKLHKEIVLP